MIINDTIFLMDESLDGLRKIHEIEALMAREDEWAKLSDEDKQAKQSALEESSRSVQSWIVLGMLRALVRQFILGNETMALFLIFTRDSPDVFCTDVLGDRIAEMLNHNVLKVEIIYSF